MVVSREEVGRCWGGPWGLHGAGADVQELVAESHLDLHVMTLWWAQDLPFPSTAASCATQVLVAN